MFPRPSKRARHARQVTRDAVSLGTNSRYQSASSREVGLNSSTGQSYSHPISPSKSNTRWARLEKWEGPEDREDFALDPNSEWVDVTLDGEVYDDHEFQPQPAPKPKVQQKRRTLRALRPQQHWRQNFQQPYLEELCRSEGRGDAKGQTACWDCLSRPKPVASPDGAAEYRCLDCCTEDLVCGDCCVRRHKHNIFHNIERWTGEYFIEDSLKRLGLVLQLNHMSNRCKSPVDCHKNLRVLHTNGIHVVNIKFCACETQVPQHLQLLRRSLYPATDGKGRIRTVATFRYLEQLHIETLTSKASIYDLYRALAKLTDNSGTKQTPWRYRALCRMVLQWRHLKSLKRAGRAHDPSGVAGTRQGELVVPCPSCPHPDINLPEDWEKSEKPFLYAAMLAMDANFRLKEQLVSSHSRDPGLCDGLGYFVPRVAYEAYVISRASDEDISTCVGFLAIAKALTKFSRGLRYTGVGAVGCARGEMFLPNSVGNLQWGERYPNMDYAFGCALRQFLRLLMVIIGYDIACQWFVNLTSRMTRLWPDELRISEETISLIPVIGKFHEPAHLQQNHERFSANLVKDVGLTDFEVMERLWALHNILGNATKTMGPGTRLDTLEAQFGFHNWMKYIAHGHTLWSRYKAAIADRNLQQEAHRGFTANIPEELTERWEKMCAVWEEDPHAEGVENPFLINEEFMSEADVAKEIAADDVQRARSKEPVRHQTSAGKFIINALELEDEQSKLKEDVKSFKSSTQTTRQSKAVLEKRSVLHKSIRGYEQLRAVYMPGLLQYVTTRNETAFQAEEDSDAEEVKLWFPSSVGLAADRDTVCIDEIATIEAKLRMARCYDALNRLRHTLRVKARMVLFKNSNVRGQRDSGRSRQLIDEIHDRAKRMADTYRRNRAALRTLIGEGEWERSLRELNNSDVTSYADPARVKRGPGRRGINEEEPGHEGEPVEEAEELSLFAQERTRKDGTGETRKVLSWIWTTYKIDVEDGADTNDDLLRSEWARSRARANRAQEEVELVREEMRRTEVFLGHQAQRWKERKTGRTDLDGHKDHRLVEGLVAYAARQARIQSELRAKFVAMWKQPLGGKVAEDQKEAAERALLGMEHAVDDDESDEDEDVGDDRGDLEMPDREEEDGEAEDYGWA